jgi:endoglucanase
MKKTVLSALGCAIALIPQFSNAQSESIKLNQIGFYPTGQKTAIVVSSKASKFSLVSASNKKDTVFSGELTKASVWEPSGEEVSKADFSSFNKPGTYVIAIKGLGESYPFEINETVNALAAAASLKMYYYQRTAIELTPEYAGKFARAAGHPDDKVLVHNSAASSKRPAGTLINSSKGWYDAGDYNKYIVNSGISMYTLLALYEDFPAYSDALKLNIPESKNQAPDLIDEINWNLRWMLSMQDPEDGGVYHKLTNPNFDGSVQPKDATNPRYVVQKTTAASLDFAAVMAQANRIYKGFSKQFPGLADSCLNASKKAYNWAKKNPTVYYIQSELKDPAIVTGAYDDMNVKDEFFWAASELFVATSDMAYFKDANITSLGAEMLRIPDWQNVGTLGIYSLVRSADKFATNKEATSGIKELKTKFLSYAKTLQTKTIASSYGVPMGTDMNDFVWGSNAVAGNQSVLLTKAYLLSKDQTLLDAAQANVDYILGRNGVGYCFLTGFGTKSTKIPHHRPSESDGIEEPVPGMIAGGPNPGQQDLPHCNGQKYPSNKAALSYMDVQCSYASNEIAINWNAPFAYSVNALEALK